MTTKLVQAGEPEVLKAEVDALILGGALSIQVVPLGQKSWYLIIYS